MTPLDEREAAFEARFVHDANLRFRCEVRQGRIAGLWAAGLLGLEGVAAQDYARSVAIAGVEAPGGDGVARRLAADLGARSDAATIRARLAEAMEEARRQLLGEA